MFYSVLVILSTSVSWIIISKYLYTLIVRKWVRSKGQSYLMINTPRTMHPKVCEHDSHFVSCCGLAPVNSPNTFNRQIYVHSTIVFSHSLTSVQRNTYGVLCMFMVYNAWGTYEIIPIISSRITPIEGSGPQSIVIGSANYLPTLRPWLSFQTKWYGNDQELNPVTTQS